MKKILIPRSILVGLEDYGFLDKHNEQCGLIQGIHTDDNDRFLVDKFFPIDNIQKGLSDRFKMEPNQQKAAYDSLEDDRKNSFPGFEMIACFHTHPYWTGHPSGIDKAMANRIGEDWIWIIYGMKDCKMMAWDWNQASQTFTQMQIIEED